MYNYRRGSDWWVDLLTTYTYHSELQVITALSLISTLYKSPQHLLSLFQPAMSSEAVPLQRLLTVKNLHLHALRFYLHSFPCRTLLSTDNCLGRPNCLQDDNSARTTQKIQPLYCCKGIFTEPLHTTVAARTHRKHRYSIVGCLYAAGVT
jgi:hypothetical protein